MAEHQSTISKVQYLQKQLDVACKERDQFKTECEKVQGILEGSESEKDVIIQNLRTQLESFHQNSITQDVLCQSLNEETHSLKKQLREVSSQCQELAQKLGDRERQHKGQFCEKTTQIEAKLKEVIEINANWQNYNDQREVYVQKLQQELNELKKKRKAETGKGTLTEEQQKTIDKILMESKKKADNMEDENMKLEDEIRNLSIQMDGMKRENERLKQHVQQLDRSKASKSTSREDRDKIQVLQAQVEILSEDFRLERQDREAAQSRIAVLEEELHTSRRRPMENNYGRVDIPTKRALALQKYQDDYYRQQQNTRRLTERGSPYRGYYDDVVVDGIDEDAEGHQNDVGLNLQTDGGFDEIDHGYDEVDMCKTDTLQCPRCQKEYPTDKHAALLEHIDICCD